MAFDRAVWTLPSDRTKNKRAHEVPLSNQAVAILEGVVRREDRELVFGQRDGPFSGFSGAKARLDERILQRRQQAGDKGGADAPKVKAMPGWTLHDLRRSVVTLMAEKSTAPHVIEAIVNHVSGHKGGVAGIYNRATYATEKRAALQAWADNLGALTGQGDATVVMFKRA